MCVPLEEATISSVTVQQPALGLPWTQYITFRGEDVVNDSAAVDPYVPLFLFQKKKKIIFVYLVKAPKDNATYF